MKAVIRDRLRLLFLSRYGYRWSSNQEQVLQMVHELANRLLARLNPECQPLQLSITAAFDFISRAESLYLIAVWLGSIDLEHCWRDDPLKG